MLNQTFKSFELIVVIDGPDPATTETLKQEDDFRIKVIELPKNIGGSGARNAGILAANGEWIAFLDDDDEWYPKKIEKQVAVINNLKEDYVMIGTGHVVRSKNKNQYFMPELSGKIFEKLLINPRCGRAPALPSVICKKSILFEVGLFDSSFASRQDIDLYLRIAKQYCIENVNEILVVVNEQSENRITDNIRKRISGFEAFYEKHYSEFMIFPKHHSIFLRQYGNLLLRNEDIIHARKQYKASFTYNPFNVKSIILYMSTLSKPISFMAQKILSQL